jgi:predicted component of type VI protein secretion system
MPNGVDKNFRRLLMACAVYHQEYGEWPTQARLHAVILRDLAQLFDHENFERLAAHMELRTRPTVGISVGGRGVVDYADVGHGRTGGATVGDAERWLGVQIRPDLEHG